jgi:hypothetical protein
LSGKLAMTAVPLLVALATVARAADEDPEEGAPASAPASEETAPAATRPSEEQAPPPDDAAPRAPDADEATDAAAYYPPPVAGPALRLPESPNRLYLDGAYAMSDDLTALPYIAGKGRNIRLALGGGWRWGRFFFEGEVPFNITTVDVLTVLNMPPEMQDQHQTAPSLGDVTLGANWTARLTSGEALIAGAGVRGRLASHTTRFQFHLADGTLADFRIPYYFHVEPTLILGGALGRFTYVINQGAVLLWGPDGNFEEQHITVPSIYFWDAHYAVGWAPWAFLGASVELTTMVQLNHIAGRDFAKLNDIRAVWVAPALQVHAGAFRIDAIARFGLTRGQELYGVLEYVGTHSFTLRVTRMFN